jgi:hypothetical protein
VRGLGRPKKREVSTEEEGRSERAERGVFRGVSLGVFGTLSFCKLSFCRLSFAQYLFVHYLLEWGTHRIDD